MTEGFSEFTHHNGEGGGDAETPVAAPVTKRKTRTRPHPTTDDGDANYRGQWQARNDDGKLAVTSSELAALKFACPPDRVKPYKHGDPIEV